MTKWEDVEYSAGPDCKYLLLCSAYKKGEFTLLYPDDGWLFRDKNTKKPLSWDEFWALDNPSVLEEIVGGPASAAEDVQSKNGEVFTIYATGAKREKKSGKGSPSSMLCGFPHTLTELHKHMDNPLGRNWEKGLPLSSYADAAFRHMLEEVSGNGDGKSLISSIWNMMCYAETKHRIAQGTLPQEIDDMDRTRYSEIKYD